MEEAQQIVSCPQCKTVLVSLLPMWKYVDTGRRWSDGYLETALLVDDNWRRLVACDACGLIEHRRAFEPSEMTATGQLEASLPVEAYFDWFAAQENLDPDIELSLRIEAWRIGNHQRRQKIIRGPEIEKEPPAEYNAKETANMHRVLELIEPDTSPAKHLLRAELYRQLGNWQAAQTAARALKGNSLESFALEIYRFALERSCWPEPLRGQRLSLPI